jgi:thioredoxin reductase (NADPH)
MTENNATEQLWDILVGGTGPAGLAAAVNGRARNKQVLVLGAAEGSQRLKQAPEVGNYLGIASISGADLLCRFLDHARKAGAVLASEVVETIYPGEEISVVTRSNRLYRASAVILTTGISQIRMLPGEKELLGRGLGYCATCDGALYRNQEVAVIAETPEAAEEVNFLAGICSKVHLFPKLKGDLQVDPKVVVHRETPRGIAGEQKVSGVQLDQGVLPVAGVFIIREVAPVERLAEGLLLEAGAIAVNAQMETNLPGVFAAGDCTGKPYQVGKAVGQGQTAALSAVHYLDERAKTKKPVQV